MRELSRKYEKYNRSDLFICSASVLVQMRKSRAWMCKRKGEARFTRKGHQLSKSPAEIPKSIQPSSLESKAAIHPQPQEASCTLNNPYSASPSRRAEESVNKRSCGKADFPSRVKADTPNKPIRESDRSSRHRRAPEGRGLAKGGSRCVSLMVEDAEDAHSERLICTNTQNLSHVTRVISLIIIIIIIIRGHCSRNCLPSGMVSLPFSAPVYGRRI